VPFYNAPAGIPPQVLRMKLVPGTSWVLSLSLAAAAFLPAADPPKPKPNEPPAVIELFEDEASSLIPQLDNGGDNDPGRATREDDDKFSGTCSLRVTPLQRYASRIKGWGYTIARNPKPGQYRFLRFAWKKLGGTGIMLQINADTDPTGWEHRYVSGNPAQPWAHRVVAAKMPVKWELVTRDLSADFGPFLLTGMAFTPMDGEAGLFDHIYLGRTIEDLDKVTNAALGKNIPQVAFTAEKLASLWEDLGSQDATVSVPALGQLVAGRKESVPFLREQLKAPAFTMQDKRIVKLIADLDADDFTTREEASKELEKIGEPAVRLLQKALEETTSAEVKTRITALLGNKPGEAPPTTIDQVRTLRTIRVLEQAGTAPAREALEALAGSKLDKNLALEVKAALARLAKKPVEKP
jgi:hypothetical protein